MNGYDTEIIEMPTWGSYIVGSGYLQVEDQDFLAAVFCGGSNYNQQFFNQVGVILASFQLPPSIQGGVVL